jgi:hypothetical protein
MSPSPQDPCADQHRITPDLHNIPLDELASDVADLTTESLVQKYGLPFVEQIFHDIETLDTPSLLAKYGGENHKTHVEPPRFKLMTTEVGTIALRRALAKDGIRLSREQLNMFCEKFINAEQSPVGGKKVGDARRLKKAAPLRKPHEEEDRDVADAGRSRRTSYAFL